jgi:hypothetical protein
MLPQFIYWLCSLTSIGCAFLLLRSHQRTRLRLLFWSSCFFICFALSNIVLVVDMVVLPQVDLTALRNGLTLGGLVLLLYGLIWETK